MRRMTARALSREARQRRGPQLPDIRGNRGSDSSVEKSKEDIITRAKMILFENKDYNRQLLSALRLSSVLHERSGQIRFNMSLRDKIRKVAEEAEQERRKEVERIAEEALAAKARRKEKMAGHRTELDRQLEEKLEMWNRRQEEKEMEREVLTKIGNELEVQARKEREDDEERRRRLKESIEEYVKSEMEIRRKSKTKEAEQEEIDRIYQVVAQQLERMRREKERELLNQRIHVSEKEVAPTRDAEVATGSQDDKLRDLLKAREERKQRLLQDILSGRRKAEEEAEARRAAEDLDRAESFRRRCRKEELDRERNRKELREALQRKKNLGSFYRKQWREKEEERKREADVDRSYAPDFTAEDKVIDRSCRQVLRLVRQHDRPAHPVVIAVKNVRKEFEIGRETNPSYLKSNVPVGRSQEGLHNP